MPKFLKVLVSVTTEFPTEYCLREMYGKQSSITNVLGMLIINCNSQYQLCTALGQTVTQHNAVD